MLKHILSGQPSSTAGSRLHHHHEYLHSGGPPSSSSAAVRQREHFHPHEHPVRDHHHPPQPGRPPPGTRAQSSADVYDNVPHHSGALGQRAAPQYQSGHRAALHHALNHSQLSVNNLAQRLNASQHSHHALNLSTLSTSKHSVNSVSPVVGAHLANYAERHGSVRHNFSPAANTLVTQLQQRHLDRSKVNGGLDISRASRLPSQATPSPAPAAAAPAPTVTTATTTTATASTGPSIVPLNVSWSSSSLRNEKGLEPGLKEVLSSLGLLCLVSLLLALLSLTFLIRMSSVSLTPNSLISPDEFAIVYDVTLVLCALALSLNLCCLLVCAIQFLFAVKLVKAPYHGQR